MRILLTGPDGQVGRELLGALAALGEVVAVDHEQLELSDPDAIRRVVRGVEPALIVNAAGYTAVDRAEDERDLAFAVNATGPGVLAEEADRLGAVLVHYSTDYVFDGRSETPYAPDAPTNPVNAYGASKLGGEEAIRATGAEALILRVSWIYGLRGRNFLLTILRQASEAAELRVVNDQTGSPTWSRCVARGTMDILSTTLTDGPAGRTLGGRAGTYHLACGGSCTWYDFARRIVERADLSDPPEVRPIPTADWPTPAERPAWSVLDCSLTRETFGVSLPAWTDALDEVFREPAVISIPGRESP